LNALIKVLIASPLEPELVARLSALDPRLEVTYRPDLLGEPRYHADHDPPVQRSAAQAAEWAALLADAEVLLDVDEPSMTDFAARVPRLHWIQSSSSGVGEWVQRLGIVESPIVVTNAAGLHGVPLAEFVLFVMLYFAKSWPRMVAEQRAHHWERCAIDTLEGKTLGIVGLGSVGRAVARLARPLGVRVVGSRRSPGSHDAAEYELDAMYGADDLSTLLGESDYVALTVPHTPETVGMLGRTELASMRPGAVLINVARGSVVDEPVLIEALRSGHLGGAALDVVAREPLSADSPLWDMPNVLVTPHSMSTDTTENERLTALFCDNLRRYAAGEPLRNVIDKVRGY
jgi:phosphoglycerate dehydrogenase-like enzyme